MASKSKRNKRSYAGLTAQESFQLIGRGRLDDWIIDAPPREPSPTLIENLRRLKSFAVTGSGRKLLIDALLAEIVPLHPNLRVWKAVALETDTLTGAADYLIAPFRDYLSTPLLCAVEARRLRGGRDSMPCRDVRLPPEKRCRKSTN